METGKEASAVIGAIGTKTGMGTETGPATVAAAVERDQSSATAATVATGTTAAIATNEEAGDRQRE